MENVKSRLFKASIKAVLSISALITLLSLNGTITAEAKGNIDKGVIYTDSENNYSVYDDGECTIPKNVHIEYESSNLANKYTIKWDKPDTTKKHRVDYYEVSVDCEQDYDIGAYTTIYAKGKRQVKLGVVTVPHAKIHVEIETFFTDDTVGATYEGDFTLLDLKGNKKTFAKLCTGDKEMSEKSVLKFADKIADSVGEELGVGDINVVFEDTSYKGQNVMGYMCADDLTTIHLSDEYLYIFTCDMDYDRWAYQVFRDYYAYEFIDTIAHEIRHIYQYTTYFEGDETYAYAIEHYVGSEDARKQGDYNLYYKNGIEVDARKYAEQYAKDHLFGTYSTSD